MYREVILWLGRRYNKKFDEAFNSRSTEELSEEAILKSSILDILQDVAYTGFNEGKVEINGETFKTGELAIAGKIVDHLRLQKLQQLDNKITISDITKYGLLRAEGDVDKPIEQNYYFIHLTFQEYLTACYLKDHLASSDQKTVREAASLIANYRNDPKYLMTLKFLSGLVTPEQGEHSQELVTRFWEAVTCNIDGTIELGIEAKINLLIHLLGQTKIKGEIDNRIPNREDLLQLIDKVILKDLLAWGNQLKDSNYINDNIKQGLFKGFLENNNIITGRYIEIVSTLINKFNLAEQEKIIARLQDIILKETAVEGAKNWQLTKQAIDGITKIATQIKLPKKDVEILVELLLHKIINANYTQAAMQSIVELLNNIKDQTLLTKVLDQISKLEDASCWEMILDGIIKLLNSLEDKTLTSSFIDQIIPLFADDWGDVKLVAKESIDTLVTNLENMELIKSVIDKIIPLLVDNDDWVKKAAIESISTLVKSQGDSKLTKSVIDKITSLFADNDYWVRYMAMESISTLVTSLEDPEFTKSAIDTLIPLLAYRNYNARNVAKDSIAKLVTSLEDPEFTKSVIDKLIPLLADTNSFIRQGVEEIIVATAESLALPKEEFIRCLNYSNKRIRDQIVNNLGESFKGFLKKIQLLEELAKGKQELQFEIIQEELFDNNLDQTLGEQILNNLHDLKNSNDQVTQEKNLTILKDTILFGLNKIGNVQSHELIEIALLVIGNDDISVDDTSKKELVQLARGVINRQIEYLSNEGIKWINDNFEDLVKISKDSKFLVRKLYHKILANLVNAQDADFIELAKELIIKSINYGMTTSLNKTGEIIFEGKKYILKGDNKDVILEEITRVLIDQDSDILAKQYREHKPLFPRTGEELEKAVADVKGESILGDQVELSHATWRVSLMHLSDHKKQEPSEVFVLLEQKDAFGYHIVHKIYVEAGKIRCQSWEKHPNKISTDFCKEIFGEMDYNIRELIKPRYYGSIISLTQKEGEQLIQELKNYKLVNEGTDYVILHEFFSNYFRNEPWDKYRERDDIKILRKDGLLKLDESQREVVKKDSASIYYSEKIASKVRRDELESFVFKVPEEISNNPKLKDYYDAIYDKLHSTIMEDTVVRGEHAAINPAEFRNANRGVDILISVGREIFKEFISPIPSIDNAIAGMIGTYTKYQSKEQDAQLHVKKENAQVSTIALNPNDRENIIKSLAQQITLKNVERITNITPKSQELKAWYDKSIIQTSQDKFGFSIDQSIYQKNLQTSLGCIDALKIIWVIQRDMIQSNRTVEDITNQLLEIPANYAFTVIKNEQGNVRGIIPVVRKNQPPNDDTIEIKDTSVQIQELSYAVDVNSSVARTPLAQLEDSTMCTSLTGENTTTNEEVGSP